MRTPLAHRLIALTASLLALAATAPVVQAQEGAVVTGKVTNPQGQPIEGASVLISSLNAGTATTTAGIYTFRVGTRNITGRAVSITARRIGFSPVTKQITLVSGNQQVDFVLAADITRLNEVVTTGVAGATLLKNTTISITKISADQINNVPASDPISALAGKVPGAVVMSTNGAPGQVAAIQLRGATNLGLGNNSPLVVIDGVIATNGMAGISAADIVSIEILKGAASANTYGSQAANGVIAITTDRGKSLAEGKLAITGRTELGQSSVGHYISLMEHHPYVLAADGSIALNSGGNRIIKPDHYADNPFPSTGDNQFRNQLQTWLPNRSYESDYVSMGYRQDKTNFFSSFSRAVDPGILPLVQGARNQNVRLNVDQTVTAKFDLSASLLYGHSTNDGAQTGTGVFFALLQSPPDLNLERPNGPNDPVRFDPDMPKSFAANDRGNPLYGLANTANVNENQRVLGSFTARFRPTTWLNLDGSYGADHSSDYNTGLTNRGYLNDTGIPGAGTLNAYTGKDFSTNIQLNSTATHDFGGLSSTTRLTYLAEQDDFQSFQTSGRKFNVGGVPTFDAMDPTTLASSSGQQTIRANDFYITQGFNYKDRYLAQLVGRRDGSSLFGTEARWKNFFGLSGAWRVTQDFNIPGFQELKLRYAVGTAGLRPQFGDQYETYTVGAGTISKNTVGNPDLQPAVQRETEGGISGTFLSRFDGEIVSSERRTVGAFLNVPLSVALTGGFSSQVQNAATIAGKTLEGSLNARVIQGHDLNYNFTVTASRTRQHIDQLGAPPFQVGSGSQGQGIFYYRQGEDMGVIYGTRFDTKVSQLLDNPANAGVSIDSLKKVYSVNDLGYVVKTASIGLPSETPVAYVDTKGNSNVKIMEGQPDFVWGLANTVHYKGFTLYGLLDGSKGGQIYNFSKQWMFQDLRSGDIDQSGKATGTKHAYDLYTNGFYNALDADSYFVENGTYAKLRELSVSYDLGTHFISQIGLGNTIRGAKISLIGRNLHTWTKYTGMDPEAASNGDPNLRLDGFRYPTFRQVAGQIQLDF
ncbi:MAG: SusC/RagA family TonB-linked outer membrane protein [Gemmatimonadaceae bacterium]